MASLFADIKTYFETKTAITNIVGGTGGASSRKSAYIFNNQIPQGAKPPYIRVEIFEGESYLALGSYPGIASNRVQIDCYDTTDAKAFTLAEAVRQPQGGNGASLENFRGTMGSRYVNEVSPDSSYDHDVDAPRPGQKDPQFWVSRDYMFHHQEPS